MKKEKNSIVFLIAFVGFSFSEESSTNLTNQIARTQEVVVSARGYATSLSETPGGTSIVGSEAIFKERPISVPNLAKNISGVTKNSDGAWGSDINIRGLSRDSVVVLIDGVRHDTANAINARLGQIDPGGVERIEVLKGPISSLYGSGTLGGVVNIITKGADFRTKQTFGGGFSTVWKSNPSGFSNFGWGSWANSNSYLYISQSYRNFDDYEDGHGNIMQNSQFVDYQTTVKAGQRLGESQTLEAQVQYYEGKNIGIPAGSDALPSGGQKVTYPATRRGLFDFVYTVEPCFGAWEESEIKIYYHFNDRRVRIDNFPPPPFPIAEIRPIADFDTVGGKWKNIFETDKHTFLAGLDIWQQDASSSREREFNSGAVFVDKPLPDSKFLSAGGFVEDSWEFADRLTLNGGARADWIRVHNDAAGPFPPFPQSWNESTETDISWNAHLGAVYTLTDELSVKGIVSSGYRAAALLERYAYINLAGSTIYGDPSLDPEESIFTEWGLDWNSSHLVASASVFYNSLNNMIVLQNRGSGPDKEYANVKEAEIFGIETTLDWCFYEGWNLFGNLSYLNGRDKTGNDDLPGIAPINGLLGMRNEFASGFWSLLELEFAAKQGQTPTGTEEAPAWQSVNLRVGYNFQVGKTSHIVYVGIDNLCDEFYYNYLSTDRSGSVVLYEPGRSFTAAWQIKF